MSRGRGGQGGGQVKAELVSVGQSGERSLKRIETGGEKASRGLKGLGRQAELLRAGVRTLGVALAGVTTVGGLAALVDRSISAADGRGCSMRPRRRASARSATSSTSPARRSRLWRGGFGSCRNRRRSGSRPSSTRPRSARSTSKLEDLRRARDQTQARIAFLEGPPDTAAPAPAPAPAPPPGDTAAVEDRAKDLARIASQLEGTLFNITHQGSERIIAEHERRLAEIEVLRVADGSNAQEIDRLIAQSAAVREAQLSQLRAKQVEAAENAFDDISTIVTDTTASMPTSADFENRIYRCVAAGTTAAALPEFNTTVGAQTTDGGALFEAEEAWSRSGLVTEATDRTIFMAALDELRTVDGWFAGGVLTWETGANAGRSIEVKNWAQATGLIELFLPMGYAIEAGDAFRIHPGCDKRLETCIERFANVLNFRGEPYVPGQDALTSYPDAR